MHGRSLVCATTAPAISVDRVLGSRTSREGGRSSSSKVRVVLLTRIETEDRYSVSRAKQSGISEGAVSRITMVRDGRREPLVGEDHKRWDVRDRGRRAAVPKVDVEVSKGRESRESQDTEVMLRAGQWFAPGGVGKRG